MMVETDSIATLSQSHAAQMAFSDDPDLLWGEALLATGQGADFQCWHGPAAVDEGVVYLPTACANELALSEGQEARHVAF
jgi:arginine/ornithine N-succinyltransferase beta subunit